MNFEYEVNAWYVWGMAVYMVYKQKGETPLEALEKLRVEEQLGKDVSLTYAGRLDPAAEGLLLILSGEDVHRKDEFLNLPKTYEFEVLFGIGTDTQDILGLVLGDITPNEDAILKITPILNTFVGSFEWEYPKYSSKTVNGKPLFQHAREGSDIETPLRTMTVERLDILESRTLALGDLKEEIKQTINKVSGDFRQDESIERWDYVMNLFGDKHVSVITFRARVQSGTYIRVLAQKMGEALGVPALALSIKRTEIGEMSI